MKVDVITLDGGKAGSVELSESIFGCEPRQDLIQRVVLCSWPKGKLERIRQRAAPRFGVQVKSCTSKRGPVERVTVLLGFLSFVEAVAQWVRLFGLTLTIYRRR